MDCLTGRYRYSSEDNVAKLEGIDPVNRLV
jgi:hypothetical protein